MVKNFKDLSKVNKKLLHENEELLNKLNNANDIIEAIRKGNIDAVVNTNNEITKLLVSENADRTYRQFIEIMSEGVVTLHSDGIIVYSNVSFARMVNFPIERVIGSNIRNFIPTEYVEKFERYFAEYPENNSKMELSFVNQKEERTHFIVSLNTLQLQDFTAINIVWTDVTDRKMTEEKLTIVNKNLHSAIEKCIFSEKNVVVLNNKLTENIRILEAANIELKTFAHIASHDLQEPLRKIITYSSLLIRDYYDIIDQRGQGYVNNMQCASVRMRSLIDDILEYSQLSQIDTLFIPTNIQLVIDEIISNLEIPINETNAIIKIEKELPVLDAISGQMRQLFQNIISNSLKFIKPGRSTEISIAYKIMKGYEIEIIDENMLNENFYVFKIKDNGIGFKEEYVNKIFTIFQKLNDNSVYNGTGIGLAICKKIVEKHNGFITAESKLNEGSLFTITIPVGQKHKQKNDYKTNEVIT